jgi:hypothetical protein
MSSDRLSEIVFQESVFSLAEALNLEDRFEEIEDKNKRVQEALLGILKKAKRGKEKIYSQEEINKIYRNAGIDLDVKRVIAQGFHTSIRFFGGNSYYNFLEVRDNQGNKKYKLIHQQLK